MSMWPPRASRAPYSPTLATVDSSWRQPLSPAPLPDDQWVWNRLRDSLQASKAARVEAQHLKAATLVAIEHDAFAHRYDERDIRFKTGRCLSHLDHLAIATATMEAEAATAMAAHEAEVASWQEELRRERAESAALRESLRKELRQAERALELQALAHMDRMEGAIAAIQAAHGQQISTEVETMRLTFDASWARLVAESEAQGVAATEARDALHDDMHGLREENAALKGTIVQLRDDGTRRREALSHEQTEAFDALHEEKARLLAENARLRETALTLRAESYSCKEALAKETSRAETYTREREGLTRELSDAYAEMERLQLQRERERARLHAYLATLHEAVSEFGQPAVHGDADSVWSPDHSNDRSNDCSNDRSKAPSPGVGLDPYPADGGEGEASLEQRVREELLRAAPYLSAAPPRMAGTDSATPQTNLRRPHFLSATRNPHVTWQEFAAGRRL